MSTSATAKTIAFAVSGVSSFVLNVANAQAVVNPTYISGWSAQAHVAMGSGIFCYGWPGGFYIQSSAVTAAEMDPKGGNVVCMNDYGSRDSYAGNGEGLCAMARVIGFSSESGYAPYTIPTQIAYEADGTYCWSFV